MPTDEHHGFDVSALERYLSAHLAGFRGPIELKRFEGGQSNPTFEMRAPRGRYVLRKKPAGQLLASAHAVEREFRVISALAGSAVPVAPARCLCEDAGVIGTPFYVMDFVEGRVYFDPRLPDLAQGDRGAMFDEMSRVVAALHKVDYRAVGLEDFGRPGNYIARQVSRWSKQYQASATEPIEAMDRLMDWLPANLPPEEPATLVHGDLRMDNMIFHPSEPRVLAVLDWELSTLGDPLSDLAYHMLTWYLRPEEFRGMAGSDLTALGIPEAEPYLTRYCERTGRAAIDPQRWNFYLVFNLFRLAAIMQGIAKRVLDGTAADPKAHELGAKARPMAEIAWGRLAMGR